MPIRLWIALVVSCLVPAVGECAAPFVEWRHGPFSVEVLEAAKKAVTSAGPEVDLGLMRPIGWKAAERVGRTVPVERMDGPYFPIQDPFAWGWNIVASLPIIDDALTTSWVNIFRKGALDSAQTTKRGSRRRNRRCREYTILHSPEVPTLRLDTRRLKLHLETIGVDRLGTAMVELWLTRDGWTWQRYQQEPHSDSLLLNLPWEGRYGLRVVIHDLKSLDSPTPSMGDAPQLWVEIDESLHLVGTEMPPQACGEHWVYRKVNLQKIPNLRKEDDVKDLRCEIRQIETEIVEWDCPITWRCGSYTGPFTF